MILERDDKIRDADDVDRIVSAEIPDPDLQPRLYAVVRTQMMHGPCGPRHPACPCMADGACSKHFPKAFQQETDMPEDGYPRYRRRDDGRTVHVRGGARVETTPVPLLVRVKTAEDADELLRELDAHKL